jgi:hypothetical protein
MEESLESRALSVCLDIYNDYDDLEIKKMGVVLIRAWEVGKDYNKKIQQED